MMRRVRNVMRVLLEPKHTASVSNGLDHHAATELRDVTDRYGQIDLDPLQVLKSAPVWMAGSEKLLLYSLIYSLRPRRYLEIGSWQGGSALTATAALDAAQTEGVIVCVDPRPNFSADLLQKIQHRCKIVAGCSPDVLPDAYAQAGGLFDFVLIDGDHSYLGAINDARGVMRYVTDDAFILFHDCHNSIVASAIKDFVAEYREQLLDFGELTREYILQPLDSQPPTRWFGFRLLKVRRANDRPAGAVAGQA